MTNHLAERRISLTTVQGIAQLESDNAISAPDGAGVADQTNLYP